MAKFIVVDEAKCLACRQCMLDCALAHAEGDDLVEALATAATLRPRVHVRLIDEKNVPVQCRHCEDAPCMEVCKPEAISRTEDGTVLLDLEKCIGCRRCVKACPFDAVTMLKEEKLALKCDLCIHRTEEGLEPACVTACPCGAIGFEELDEQQTQQLRAADKQLAASIAREAGTDAKDE
jgi:carbon-monoxide dehydrogenase iron sulfur subunit